MSILANIFMILGVTTLVISGIGIVRLPSFLTRIHPVAKSTTLGIILFFIGVAIMEPSWAPKLVVAIILFMFTGPVSASSLGRTALSKEEKEEFYPSSEEVQNDD